MRFSDEEIEAAKQLREHGLAWEPKVGDYLFDGSGFCQQPSPFQEKVYFILNYSYFMRIVGGVERFKEIMLWLPTWDDLRELLRQFRISDVDVAQFLRDHQAIESGRERLVLYKLVDNCLLNKAERSTVR